MTEKEVKQRSSDKIRQIKGLMNTLKLDQVVKTRINREGFLEDVIMWVDNEKYEIDKEVVADTNVQEVTTTNNEGTDNGVSETTGGETAEETGV